MSTDAELLSVLPRWLGYSRLVIGLPTAFVATFVGTWIGAQLVLPNRRTLSDLHWAERARVVHPARVVVGFFILSAPVFFGVFFGARAGPFDALPAGLVGALAAVSAFAGATLASRSIQSRATGEDVRWARHMGSQLWTLVILAPHVLILFFMLATVGGEFGRVSVGCAILGCVAMLLAALHSGLPVARLLGAVRPASPRLVALVQDVGRRMDFVPRSVEEVDLGMANAWALPAAKRLVFTPQLVAELDDEGLRGIIAHELGHLKDPACAWVIGVRVLAFLPLGFIQPAMTQFGMTGLAAIYISFVGLLSISSRLGRQGEEHADAAVLAADVDGPAYARALERLHIQNLSPAVMNARSSHPSLYDRMVSAGIEPDFERPPPPSFARGCSGSVAAAIGVVVTVLAVYLPSLFISEFDMQAEREAHLELAWRGAKASPLFSLARERMAEGRSGQAMVLVDAAVELRPGHHAYRAARADLLASGGECESASLDLDAAIDSATAEHGATCHWIERATDSLIACGRTVAKH